MAPRFSPARRRFVLTLAILLLALPLRGSVQSTYLWEALDSTSYDYAATVLADTDGNYRAYWCATEGATANATESEGAFVKANNVPWNFYPPQQYALRTTGVRIVRERHVATNERWDRIMQFDFGIPAGYTTDRVLGFLRRDRHDASGASIELWECTWGSDHFITAFKDYECPGLPATKLGYAYNTGGAGLSPRYRCIHPGTGDHMTSMDPGCEGTGYTLEGPLGNWRDGGSYTHPQLGTWEVSPFGDGAFLCPSSVIKDSDNVYYMSYTASPHIGNGGPFNELFLATSTDGTNFTPVVDAAGMPRRLATYTSTYQGDVRTRDAELGYPGNISTAFGVGGGSLLKVGGEYRLYFADSSRYISSNAPGCPNHVPDVPKGGTQWRQVLRTASSITGLLDNATEAGQCVTAVDQNGAQASFADQQAFSGAPVVNDTQNGLYWTYRGEASRTVVYWARSGDTSGTTFFVAGPNQGTVNDLGGDNQHHTPAGLFRDRYGSVSSCCGWYVYVGHSHRTCDPGSDNTCGFDHMGVTLFQPQ
jgi:hypothetical protein